MEHDESEILTRKTMPNFDRPWDNRSTKSEFLATISESIGHFKYAQLVAAEGHYGPFQQI